MSDWEIIKKICAEAKIKLPKVQLQKLPQKKYYKTDPEYMFKAGCVLEGQTIESRRCLTPKEAFADLDEKILKNLRNTYLKEYLIYTKKTELD